MWGFRVQSSGFLYRSSGFGAGLVSFIAKGLQNSQSQTLHPAPKTEGSGGSLLYPHIKIQLGASAAQA